jgi:hypothetical protein
MSTHRAPMSEECKRLLATPEGRAAFHEAFTERSLTGFSEFTVNGTVYRLTSACEAPEGASKPAVCRHPKAEVMTNILGEAWCPVCGSRKRYKGQWRKPTSSPDKPAHVPAEA